MSFYIKQNDTSPSLRARLEDGVGNDVDLTGASVRFHMKPIGTSVANVDAAAIVVVSASENNLVQYDWAVGDTASVGSYQAEFEVTRSDGTIETFPNNGYIRVEITDDIA